MKEHTSDEFTETELMLLKTMFRMADAMSEGIKEQCYWDDLSNSLFNLSCKLGVNDIVY